MNTISHAQTPPSGGHGAGGLLTDPGLVWSRITDLAGRFGVPAACTAVVAAAGILVLAAGVRRMRQRRWASGARLVEVFVPPEVKPASAEIWWEQLHGALTSTRWRRWLSGTPHLGFEYRVSPEDGAVIRIWVPGCVPPHLVENAVGSAWRGARTRTVAAAPPLPAPPAGQQGLLAGGALRLAQHERWPIRTDGHGDPADAVIAAAAGMPPGYTACLQILARPVVGRRARHTTGPTSRRGVLLAGMPGDVARDVFGLFFGRPRTRTGLRGVPEPVDRQARLQQSARDHAAASKTRGTHWSTVIRYAVTATVPADADRDTVARAGRVVRGRAHAVSSCLSGCSDLNHYRRRRCRRLPEVLAGRRLGRGDLLSTPELATIAHLPLDAGIAEIHRAGARALAPTAAIPIGGPGTKPLGVADATRGRRVAMRVADARHHVHVLGPTGCGKSTLLAHMALADSDAGRGLVLIDPKGDLVTDILKRLPRHCVGKVVLLDADSASPPPCFNPLDLSTVGRDVALVVDNLGTVFRRIYHQFWGPRTDDLFRNALLTVLAQPATATLADVARLLTDDTYRARLTAGVNDPVVQGFWRTFEALGDPGRNQLTSPLLNKLRHLLLRPFVKTALAAGPATVDLGGVLDQGGLVLARLPKGRLGEETTRLVGALLVARTWQAATARAATPTTERRDAALYLDEFHNFLHSSTPVEDMLAEARALKLSMVLAHQHLGQLTPTVREAVSTNARNKIVFSVSPEDARDLARHTQPHLGEHDLAHLDAYHAATRLIVRGQNTPPCTVATEPLPPAIRGRSAEIRAAARAHTTRTSTARPVPAPPAPRPPAPPGPGASDSDPRRR
ncbi:type IV secretory system conjugative DNA transfer family protein [Nocardia wallacei]|uniref:type IV secretory system conjugative DNA transfer family protein n=1 Tax=Nocardia wallacei TaxID=480035 RepID=UPI0024553522|nr:type VI secretion protein [Nocardia wallacei]